MSVSPRRPSSQGTPITRSGATSGFATTPRTAQTNPATSGPAAAAAAAASGSPRGNTKQGTTASPPRSTVRVAPHITHALTLALEDSGCVTTPTYILDTLFKGGASTVDDLPAPNAPERPMFLKIFRVLTEYSAELERSINHQKERNAVMSAKVHQLRDHAEKDAPTSLATYTEVIRRARQACAETVADPRELAALEREYSDAARALTVATQRLSDREVTLESLEAQVVNMGAQLRQEVGARSLTQLKFLTHPQHQGPTSYYTAQNMMGMMSSTGNSRAVSPRMAQQSATRSRGRGDMVDVPLDSDFGDVFGSPMSAARSPRQQQQDVSVGNPPLRRTMTPSALALRYTQAKHIYNSTTTTTVPSPSPALASPVPALRLTGGISGVGTAPMTTGTTTTAANLLPGYRMATRTNSLGRSPRRGSGGGNVGVGHGGVGGYGYASPRGTSPPIYHSLTSARRMKLAQARKEREEYGEM
eukprot:PhM_4_TR3011/c0_g1_i1/m.89523